MENSWWEQRWVQLGLVIAALVAVACGVVALTGQRDGREPLPDRPTVPGRPDVPVVPSSSGNGAAVPG